MIKTSLLIGVLISLSACGGGGESTTSSSTQALQAKVLSTFTNGEGIAQIYNDTLAGFIYGPDIVLGVQELNSTVYDGNSSSITEINPSDFPVITQTDKTSTRKGIIDINGTAQNITILNNKITDEASGIYLRNQSGIDLALVIGNKFTNPPTNGVGRYDSIFTWNARTDYAPGKIGNLILTIDYGTNTFEVIASNDSDAGYDYLVDSFRGGDDITEATQNPVFDVRYFANSEKDTIWILYINGMPSFSIPSGFFQVTRDQAFSIRDSVPAHLSGKGLIDMEAGIFASSDITFRVNGKEYNAALFGQLNGESANSVSGIFFTNGYYPVYAGSFIAAR